MANRSTEWWSRWWPFLLLCLVGLFRGIATDAIPAANSSLLSLTLGSASAFLVVLTWLTILRDRRASIRSAVAAAIAAILFLAGPFVALIFAVHGVEPTGLVMALALTPVVIAVARPVFRETHGAEIAGRLWPGIAAVAGLLLLLPQPSLASPAADVALAAAPILTGVGAMWFRSIAAPKLLRATIGLSASTIAFLLAAAARHTLHVPADHQFWLAVVLDGATCLLTVLALLRIGGTRWSAQFVLVPTAIILVALADVHTLPDARSIAGVVVLVLATIFLLLPPPATAPEEIGLGR